MEPRGCPQATASSKAGVTDVSRAPGLRWLRGERAGRFQAGCRRVQPPASRSSEGLAPHSWMPNCGLRGGQHHSRPIPLVPSCPSRPPRVSRLVSPPSMSLAPGHSLLWGPFAHPPGPSSCTPQTSAGGPVFRGPSPVPHLWARCTVTVPASPPDSSPARDDSHVWASPLCPAPWPQPLTHLVLCLACGSDSTNTREQTDPPVPWLTSRELTSHVALEAS